MRVRLLAATLISVQVSLACYAEPASAPSQPDLSHVSAIHVTALVPEFGAPDRRERQITDESTVSSVASGTAFRLSRWLSSRRQLVPVYRIEFLDGDTTQATYYLGANSYPPRFPCYAFCSGWWLGTAREDGTFDSTRYVGLTSTQYWPLVTDLGIP